MGPHPPSLERASRVALSDTALARVRRYLEAALVDNALALVTSAYGQATNVMTAGFFAESSHVPPLLRLSVAKDAFTHTLIQQSGRFGLSLLARGQEKLAILGGTLSGREVDKLAVLELRSITGDFGVPILPDCLTTSECLVVDTVDLPDHSLFVAEIASSHRQSTIAFRDTLLISNLHTYIDKLKGAV